MSRRSASHYSGLSRPCVRVRGRSRSPRAARVEAEDAAPYSSWHRWRVIARSARRSSPGAAYYAAALRIQATGSGPVAQVRERLPIVDDVDAALPQSAILFGDMRARATVCARSRSRPGSQVTRSAASSSGARRRASRSRIRTPSFPYPPPPRYIHPFPQPSLSYKPTPQKSHLSGAHDARCHRDLSQINSNCARERAQVHDEARARYQPRRSGRDLRRYDVVDRHRG